MKKSEKQLGPDLWQLWKDSLALSAAILTFFAIIDITLAYFLHYEPHFQSFVSQLTLQLPAVIFGILAITFISVFVTQRLTMKYTERLKHNVGLCLAITAITSIIILFIATVKWGAQGTWTWVAAGLLLVLNSSGGSMLLPKQPRQPEEPLSKAKEREEVPNTPKPERKKIALTDWFFEWWKMWKNILALLATISALAYTLADFILHVDTTQIGTFVAKYSELALILFASLFVITLIIYGIIIARRNKSSSCKTK
jgi:hypothetical protein